MATLTIRNVPSGLVRSLKQVARQRRHSMEREVRELLEESLGERLSVIEQIKADWKKQKRRPTAAEIETWIAAGRA